MPMAIPLGYGVYVGAGAAIVGGAALYQSGAAGQLAANARDNLSDYYQKAQKLLSRSKKKEKAEACKNCETAEQKKKREKKEREDREDAKNRKLGEMKNNPPDNSKLPENDQYNPPDSGAYKKDGGWVDSEGDRWVPHSDSIHDPHYDVVDKNGDYRTVYPK
jgi:hypothetical protein